MWKTKKRLLSLFVSVCMVLSMLPVTARAEVNVTADVAEITAGADVPTIILTASDGTTFAPIEDGSAANFEIGGEGRGSLRIESASTDGEASFVTLTLSGYAGTTAETNVEITIKAAAFTGSEADTTITIPLVPGEAKQLQIEGPAQTNVASGAKLEKITVTVQDQHGNTVKKYTDTVNATMVEDGNWTLRGNQTVNAVEGVATFDNLVVENNGYENSVIDATIKFTASASDSNIEGYTAPITIEAKAKVAPTLTTSSKIEVGDTEVEVQLTSSYAFNPSLNKNQFTIDSGRTSLTISDATSSGDKNATLTFAGTATAGTLTITAQPGAFSDSEGLTESETASIIIPKGNLDTKSITITGMSGNGDSVPQVGDTLEATFSEKVGDVTWEWTGGTGSPKNENTYTVEVGDIGKELTVTATAKDDNADYTGEATQTTDPVVAKPVALTGLTVSDSSETFDGKLSNAGTQDAPTQLTANLTKYAPNFTITATFDGKAKYSTANMETAMGDTGTQLISEQSSVAIDTVSGGDQVVYIYVSNDGGGKAYYKLTVNTPKPTGEINAKLNGGDLYAGTSVAGQTITLTLSGSAKFKTESYTPETDFTLGGTGAEGLSISEVESREGTTATLTLFGTPTTAGSVTITANPSAFEVEPSGKIDATGSITVKEAPTGTVTAALDGGTLTAGVDASSVQIKLTPSGLTFADSPDKDNFELGGKGFTGLTVNGAELSENAVLLTLTGIPEQAGDITVTIDKAAFNPLPAAEVTSTAVNVGYPDIKMTVTPTEITEGDGVSSFTLNLTGGQFTANPTESFSLSGIDGAEVDSVTAADGANTATLTLKQAPDHDGTLTITVQPAAFKYQPSTPVKAEVTVNAPEPTLEATTTLVAGTAGGTITITESSDADADNFRSGATSDQFTITTGDYKESLTVSEVKVDETSVTLTITGIPTKAGQLNIEVAPGAFEYKPKEKVTATVTVGYPTVEMTADPASIIEGQTKEFTLTLTGGQFAANPTGSITVAGIDGVSVTSVTAEEGSTTAKLTLNQVPTHKGTMTITADLAAFKYQPKAAVTASVNVRSATVSLTGTTTLTVGREGGTITLTEEGDAFKPEAAASMFTLTGEDDIASGLAVESLELDETRSTATLTITGTPKKSGELTVTVVTAAFTLDLETAVTATVTVSPAPSAPSTTVDKPDTDTTTGETTVDVNTNSTLSGTTANASVSGTNMDKAVNSAVDAAETAGTSPVVEVNVNTSSRADGINVTLPANSLDKLAQAEGSSLVIVSDVAEVALDNTALTALAEQADTTAILSVTPAKNMNEAQAEAAGTAPVVDVTVTSGGKVITDYHGGVLLITLPYTLPAGHDASSVVVFYLDDAGKLTACATSYKDGKVTFLTKHLSKYVIGSTDMNEVTLTAASTLAAGVSGGTITLTATGAAFAEAAAVSSFTLSATGLTVSAVQVSGATATLTVTGTPAAGTLTVTAKKEAFDPAAADDATATVTVAEAAPTPTAVTLTATSTLAVGVNGGTITLTTDGAAFAGTADKANFTLSDTALTVTAVKVDGKTATLTVAGTPAESETLTVTVKKEAITGAEADASVRLNVTLFTFDFTFETSMVDGRLVLNVGIEVFLRRNLLVTIPVVIPIG